MSLEPYFSDGDVQLYLGDCREILPALGVMADCILADPPYAETSLAWDQWPDGWLEVAAGVTRSMWCFGSLRMFLERGGEFTAARWKLSQDVVWEKANGTGFAADRFKRVHESAAHWYRGDWGGVHHDAPRVPYIGPDKHIRARHAPRGEHLGDIGTGRYDDDGTRMARSVQFARSVRGGLHPTEKPVPLLTLLISYACPGGGACRRPVRGQREHPGRGPRCRPPRDRDRAPRAVRGGRCPPLVPGGADRMSSSEPCGSFCIPATCLPHRRRVFVQHWPHDDGQPYRWVHTDLSPCPETPPQAADAVLLPLDWRRYGTEWTLRRLTPAEMAGASS